MCGRGGKDGVGKGEMERWEMRYPPYPLPHPNTQHSIQEINPSTINQFNPSTNCLFGSMARWLDDLSGRGWERGSGEEERKGNGKNLEGVLMDISGWGPIDMYVDMRKSGN